MSLKPGRNEPCPCGSGKKYKKCCQEKDVASPLTQASMKSVLPSPDECSQLVALYNAERYVELESQTRLLIEKYPESGFAWKALGAALKAQGKNCLPSMQKAAELIPDDAEVHYNLGNAQNDLWQQEVAVASYRRALEIKPDFAEAHNNLGSVLRDLGQLDDAAASYRRALEIRPEYADAHGNLGNVLRDLGQLDDAAASYRRALAIRPDFAEAHGNLGNVLRDLGHLSDAQAGYRRALKIKPDYAEAHSNLGNVLQDLGQLDDAAASYHRALAIKPDFAEAHNNLGNVLRDLGHLSDAQAGYRRALKIKPDYAEAHSNLGNVLKDLGQLDDAVASYRRALQIKPDYADAHSNLGSVQRDLGQLDDAVACYRRALEIKPDYPDAHSNIASILNEQGKTTLALGAIHQSLQFKETEYAKNVFISCIKHLRFTHDDRVNRIAIVRALTEPWGRPSELATVGIELVKLNPDIGEYVARAAQAWPRRLSSQQLYGPYGSGGLNKFAPDPLLCALLNSVAISDIEMERFLTMARGALLDSVTGLPFSDGKGDANLAFYCALARQCFINEYVFTHTDEEFRKASDLRDCLSAALGAKTQVPDLWPIVVATYFPLNTVPLAAQLLNTPWPDEVASLLSQQICEPKEERQLIPSIPRITDIENEVSLLVQNQYEENPYPRWVKVAPKDKPVPVHVVLRRLFPFTPFQPHIQCDNPDILIAGCGTGQHSIYTAQRFKGARVLAVDLSMSSLSYAKRKTREMGLTSIEYAQADLLKLESLGRSFDVVESAGVLHHLADPWAGWRILLSLLRPGGFMRLGFYSELARRHVVRIRTLIAEQGYGSSPEDIRRCRQDLMNLDKSSTVFGTTLKVSDFYSISTCRDLLFHVQEHRMTLTGIESFLHDNHLVFLGFEIDPNVLRAYKLRFPEDIAATNLGQWQIFENENPDIFFGMYQFWVQK